MRPVYELTQQTFKDFELIVVLDGKDEETQAVCEKFRPQFKQGTIIEHESNLGVNRAILSGLEIACGEYVVLVSVDDRMISNDFFADGVSFLKRNGSCGLVSDQGTFEEDKSGINFIQLGLSDKPIFWPADEFIKVLKRKQFHMGSNTIIYKKLTLKPWASQVELEQIADWYLNLSIALQQAAIFPTIMLLRIHKDPIPKDYW